MAREVLVHTWPYQWVYWPVYRAMELVQLDGDFTFKFCTANKAGSTYDSDAQIIRDLNRGASSASDDVNPIRIAICEPPRTSDQTFRKIPVLWRLPHWLIGRGDALVTDSPESIYVFSKESTSGRFVRELYSKSVKYKPFSASDYRSVPEKEYVVTFVPLHRVWPGDYTRMDALAGPLNDITAIIIPQPLGLKVQLDGVKDKRHAEFNRLHHGLLQHLREVLLLLHGTQGRWKQIRDLMREATKHDGSICEQNASLAGPMPEDLEDRAKLLAVYIQHGCYFPYWMIDHSLGDEIERAVADGIAQQSSNIATMVRGTLQQQFGGQMSWGELSFEQRIFAHSNYKHLTSKTNTRPLWDHLSHTAHSGESLLTEIVIRTQPESSGRLLASYKGDDWTAACVAYRVEGYGQFDAYACRAQTLLKHQKHCFLCDVCGFISALDGTAVVKLRSMGVDVGKSIGVKRVATVLAWSDIEKVFQVFIDNSRAKCPRGICSPGGTVWLIWKTKFDKQRRIATSISLAIVWKGCTHENTGDGDANSRLVEWAQVQEAAQHPVSRVGFWRPSQPSRILWPIDRGNYRFSILDDPDWPDHSDGGDFAYVVEWSFGGSKSTGGPSHEDRTT